jgi:hypothetical protein
LGGGQEEAEQVSLRTEDRHADKMGALSCPITYFSKTNISMLQNQ